MSNKIRSGQEFRCIECGCPSEETFHDYGKGIIKISHCLNCKKVVDKYIEFDPVIILLDALLFKPQAYRHILFNKVISFHWRLSILCLLCDAYMKWARKSHDHTQEESRPFVQYALQWDFFAMFLVAGLELAAFITGVMSVCWLNTVCTHSKEEWEGRVSILTKALLLSSAGKLLVIPAVIWGETHIFTTRLLTKLFMAATSTQSVAVILDCRLTTSLVLVLCGFGTEFLVGLLSPLVESVPVPG